MNVNSRIRLWRERIEDLGGRVATVERGKHLKFILMDGQMIVIATTPTCHRGDANQLAQIRRLLGVQPEPKPAPQKPKPATKPRRPVKEPQAAPEPSSGIWRTIPEKREPQRIENPRTRQRLGLDGGLTPKPVRFYQPGERPLISLGGKRGAV